MENLEGLPSKLTFSSEEVKFKRLRCSHCHYGMKGIFPRTLNLLVSLQIGRKTDPGLLQGVPGSAQSLS